MSVAIGDIVSATGEMIVPRGEGDTSHARQAPDGPFVVVGFFGKFAKLRDVYADPDAKELEFDAWPVDQLVKN